MGKEEILPLQKTLGLALSGGGARGLAHIGVLKALDKANIKVSCISGCSMGGLVGALFALGHSISEIEEIAVKHTSLSEMIKIVDRTPRRRGLIVGQRLRNLLANIIGADTLFSDTKIPLVVNAVDLISSQEITLSDGNLVNAIMATISIPGFFAPVKIGDYQLIDGGMLNNLPVSNLKLFNPEVTMAVDVHPDITKEVPWQFSDSKPRWTVPVPDSFLDLYRAELIMSYYLTDFYLSCNPPDIFIRPELPPEITTFYGYQQAAKLINLGEKHIQLYLSELKELVFS